MMASLQKLPLVLGVVLGLLAVSGQADVDPRSAPLRAVFYPYQQGPAQAEGIIAGLRLDRTTFEVARAVLPAELLQYGLAGDFAVTVQPTTDMPLQAQYIAATEHYASQVELGEGELRNYVAGLPFPLIDPHDPRAGEKVAWNLRYQDEGETKQYWSINEHRTGSGIVARSERFYSIVQTGMHRPAPGDNPAAWEKLGVYMKRYNLMLSPADSASLMDDGNTALGNVTADGSFTLSRVPPGSYVLRPTYPPSVGWRIESAMWRDVDIADVPITIAYEDVDGIAVTLTPRSPMLTGRVTDAAGTPMNGLDVVLFPIDPALRLRNSRRVATARTSVAGDYEIRGLPPGDYGVALVDDVDVQSLRDPAVLAQLTAVSTVTLTAADSRHDIVVR